MGGGGSMGMANASLKFNRGQLNKRKYKDLKKLYATRYSKDKPMFKEVSSEELALIKCEIRKKLKSQRRKTLIISSVITTILSLGLALYLLN